MRVWIDISNSPQVPFFRPLVALLRDRGHDVRVTTREYAQTSSCSRSTASSTRSSGRSTAARERPARRVRWPVDSMRYGASHAARTSTSRSRTRRTSCRWSRARSAFRPRTPSTTSSPAFSTDSAVAPRAASSSPTRSRRTGSIVSGRAASKVRRYPGLKEEYYLAGFEPDTSVLDELELERERVLVVVRTPPDVSLYHRHGEPAVRGRARETRATMRRCRRSSCHGPTSSAASIRARRASVARPARARGRRAESRRALRPRRLGRRHDEPRGGRARCRRLHDVRGTRSVPSTSCSSPRAGSASSRPRTTIELTKRASRTTTQGRDPALVLDLMLSALDG